MSKNEDKKHYKITRKQYDELSYKIIRKIVFSKNNTKVQQLVSKPDLDYEDVAHEVWLRMRDKLKHYDDSLSKLSTFINKSIDQVLVGFIRERYRKKRQAGKPHIGFKEVPDVENYEGYKNVATPDKVLGHLITMVPTPEEEILADETRQVISKHFNSYEVQVLLGQITRAQAAEELGETYDAFTKRLKRKLEKFKQKYKLEDFL